MEIWKHSRVLYEGTIIKLRVGEVELDNGALAHREVVEHPGGVCVVPYTGKGVVLVRQYRIALKQYLLEAPAGKLEGEEAPEHRAACELEEETGYRAGRIVPVGTYFSTVGFCTERMHLFLALDLEAGEQRLEEEERIELVEMSMDEVRSGLKAHVFEDAKTVVVLQALVDYLAEP